MVEVLDHAEEVSSLVLVGMGGVTPGLQVVGFLDARRLRDSVRIDLIEDSVFDPIWGVNGLTHAIISLTSIADFAYSTYKPVQSAYSF